MDRDSFMCQNPGCLATKSTLNVHHLKYSKNGDPWDIDSKYLLTLCEHCHKKESEDRLKLETKLIQLLREKRALYYDMLNLVEHIEKHEDVSFHIFCLWSNSYNLELK